ncbi:lysophospholipid acyltransferase family protein [Persephonella sp.]
MSELFINILFRYLKKLSREKALKRGEQLGDILYKAGYRKKVVRKNLDIAFPDKPFRWKEEISRKSLQNTGRILAEFPKLPDYVYTGEIKDIFHIADGKEILDRYSENGAILLTAHLGNWELGNIGLSSYGYRITALAYRQKNKKINQIIENIRKSAGTEIIYHDQPMRRFIEVLNENKIIAFLVDQNALRHRGVFVDFFGKEASTVTFPAKLALKYEKPVVFSYTVFNPDNKAYYTYFREIPVEDLKKNDIKTLTERYTKEVEEAVKKYPEQYLWTHKRWKTRPEGEPENIY